MTSTSTDCWSAARCRACGGDHFVAVLDLGETPLANATLSKAELDDIHAEIAVERRYPLDLNLCKDCGLLFLSTVVAPEILFSHYLYVTGASTGMTRHLQAYADDIAERFLSSGDLAVEMGSNDGTFLAGLPDGIERLGIEPAANLADDARKRGVPTHTAFFGRDVARELRSSGNVAKVIVANNVFAHIDDWDSVAEGCLALLADDGVFVIEAPGNVELLQTGAFDTIYHEHLSVVGLHAVSAWAERHGLRVFDVAEQSVHGGSIRIHLDRGVREIAPSVETRLAREKSSGVLDVVAWSTFDDRVRAICRQLKSAIDDANQAGTPVVAYGATAKSTTILAAADVGPGEIAFICDKNARKQGRFLPGTHTPIVHPDELAKGQSRLCLMLAWNIAAEIAAEQSTFLDDGGRFLVPLPEFRFLDAGSLPEKSS